MILCERIPMLIPVALAEVAEAAGDRPARAELALVVHRDVQVEDSLLHPRAPVLEHLAVRPGLLPAARLVGSIAVGDGVGADAQPRLDRVRLEIDPAHDAGDLVAPPLAPLEVVGERLVSATRQRLEPRERDRVVAPRVVERPGGEREVRVADAVEVEAVDVVVLGDARVPVSYT